MAIIPDTIKLEAVFSQDGQATENVHYFTTTASIDTDLLQSLGRAYVAWYEAHLQGWQPSNISLMKLKITDMTADNGQGIEYQTDLPLTGDNPNSDSLPNNCTVAVKWITAFRGRSYRGRTYHIGMSTNMADGSYLAPTYANLLSLDYSNLLTLTDDANSFALAVVSLVSGGVARESGIATPVVGCTVEGTIDSQRRRLPGRGR